MPTYWLSEHVAVTVGETLCAVPTLLCDRQHHTKYTVPFFSTMFRRLPTCYRLTETGLSPRAASRNAFISTRKTKEMRVMSRLKLCFRRSLPN